MPNSENIKFASIAKINSDEVEVNSVNFTDEIFFSEISDAKKIVNFTKAEQHELVISYDDEKTNFIIDINGDLLVFSENAENYSINENGDLLFSN